jgi:hypothetical protein
VLSLAVAGAIVIAQAWHGPIVLWLSADHGIDAGDLLAFPAIVAAIALIGPTLVALWLAAPASSRAQTASFLLAAAVFSGLTIASLEDLAGLNVPLSRAEGAIARTAALGALFLLGGLQSVSHSASVKRRA